MATGQHPKGYPVDLSPRRTVPPEQAGASDCDKIDRMTLAVFGHDMKFHAITGLPLQQGSGSLPPDEQALRDHLPRIMERDGIAVAREILAKLKRRMENGI
jgi:hypothetical protein